MHCRRFAIPRMLAAAAISLTLGTLSAPAASADVSIRISSGFSSHHHGHRHHRGHRPRRSHGVPFVSRRHAYSGFRHRPLHRHPPRHYHRHGRYFLGAACAPATQRARDHHGRVIITVVTVCYDRHGRPYVPAGRAYRY